MAVSFFRRERQYDAWHGTRDDVKRLAQVLMDREIAVKVLETTEFEVWLARVYEEAEAKIRQDLGVPADVPVPAETRDEYDKRLTALNQERQQRQKIFKDQLNTPTTSFSYTGADRNTKAGPSLNVYDAMPVGVVAVIMTLNSSLMPTASVSLTLRKRPYVFLELSVASGNDGWVATTFEALNVVLMEQQPQIRKLVLRQWPKSIIGIFLWVVFVVPLSTMVQHLPMTWKMPAWTAVPLALLPVGLVVSLFDWLMPPFAVVRSKANALIDGAKAIGLLALTELIRRLLELGGNWLARGL